MLSPTSSSLEQMLENIKCRDDKPKDLPPPLPCRRTSRGRLPPARRSLPKNFRISEEETNGDSKEGKRSPDDITVESINSFGRKKTKFEQLNEDSTYNYRDSRENAVCERPDAVAAANSTSRPAVDWDDNVDYFIKKKLFNWCRLSSGQWESGIIQSTSGEEASVRLVTGKVVTVLTRDLLPAKPDILDGVDDLIQLSYLNEPSVLHNLQYRYHNDMIYSNAGPILIAVNPSKMGPILTTGTGRSLSVSLMLMLRLMWLMMK